MSGGIFVFCETKDGGFRRVCGELLTQFRSVADAGQQTLCAIVVGEPVADELPQLSEWAADKVVHVTSPQLSDAPEALAAALTAFAREAAPSLLVFGNTPLARAVAPQGRGRPGRRLRRRLLSLWTAGTTGFTSCAPSTAASCCAGSAFRLTHLR